MTPRAPFDWAKVVDYAKREQTEYPKTQYELPGVTIEEHGDEAVPAVVPPLWHAVVTARLTIPPGDSAALKQAQQRLENIYPLRPAGIFTQVAYGLPYFRNYIRQGVTDQYMPRNIQDGFRGDWAVIDSIKFPKDKPEMILEQNDICFHFKSDYHEHIENTLRALFYAGEYFLNGAPATSIYVGDLFKLSSIKQSCDPGERIRA